MRWGSRQIFICSNHQSDEVDGLGLYHSRVFVPPSSHLFCSKRQRLRCTLRHYNATVLLNNQHSSILIIPRPIPRYSCNLRSVPQKTQKFGNVLHALKFRHVVVPHVGDPHGRIGHRLIVILSTFLLCRCIVVCFLCFGQ